MWLKGNFWNIGNSSILFSLKTGFACLTEVDVKGGPTLEWPTWSRPYTHESDPPGH